MNEMFCYLQDVSVVYEAQNTNNTLSRFYYGRAHLNILNTQNEKNLLSKNEG